MKKFARILDGRVVEITSGDTDIVGKFHPDLVWVDASAADGVCEGWSYDNASFAAPPPASPAPVQPGLPELRAQLAALLARVEALAGPAVIG